MAPDGLYSVLSMLDLLAIVIGALDSLPNFGRTMLSASAFAGLLCYIATRLPADQAAVSVSYRKATLLALLIVPLLGYYVMDGRLVVVVDALPGIVSAPTSLWWVLAVGWMFGVLWNFETPDVESLGDALITKHLQTRARLRAIRRVRCLR